MGPSGAPAESRLRLEHAQKPNTRTAALATSPTDSSAPFSPRARCSPRPPSLLALGFDEAPDGHHTLLALHHDARTMRPRFLVEAIVDPSDNLRITCGGNRT